MIARRQVDVGGVNQELMYMSLKFINNIWVLVEVKVAPGASSVGVRIYIIIPLEISCEVTPKIDVFSLSAACSEDICPGCDSWRRGGL